jgi:hypothetical protein
MRDPLQTVIPALLTAVVAGRIAVTCTGRLRSTVTSGLVAGIVAAGAGGRLVMGLLAVTAGTDAQGRIIVGGSGPPTGQRIRADPSTADAGWSSGEHHRGTSPGGPLTPAGRPAARPAGWG